MPQAQGPFPFLTRDMLAFNASVQFQLKIRSRAGSATAIYISGFTRSGYFRYRHVPSATYALVTDTFILNDVPISLTIQDTDGNQLRGDCFVTADLAINGDIISQLCGGYVWAQKGVSWPAAQIDSPAPLSGNIVVNTPAAPGNGNELNFSVPANRIWRLISVSLTLITNATVANRDFLLEIQPLGTDALNIPSSITQAASKTFNYNFGQFGSKSNDVAAVNYDVPLPSGLILQDSDVIQTVTTNLQGTDHYVGVTFYVEQFIKI